MTDKTAHRIELINLLLNSISAILAATALLLYINYWQKDKHDNFYSTLDANYNEVLKAAMEYGPIVRNPHFTAHYLDSGYTDHRDLYNTYALMAFNFCETVYDYHDEALWQTWEPIIAQEYALHHTWLWAEGNARKFKPAFVQYLKERMDK